MKKILLYTMFSFVMAGLVSCDENFEKGIADPQGWEQEDAKEVSFKVAAVDAIDLSHVAEEVVQICTISDVMVDEEEYTVTYRATLDGTYLLNVDEDGYVAKMDIQKAVAMLYGGEQIARTMTMVVDAFVDIDGKVIKESSGPIELIVTPELRILYVPGNHQGWNVADAPQVYTTNMDSKYTGHMYLNGAFKLFGQPDWVPVEYGYSKFTSLSNNIVDAGSDDNMLIDPDYYFVEVDLNTQSIKATMTKWSIIGEAVGGWGDDPDRDDDVPMRYDDYFDTWAIVTDMQVGEFKFRANKSWDINMGGTEDKLELNNSNNLTISESGKYHVTLQLGHDGNSSCKLIKRN